MKKVILLLFLFLSISCGTTYTLVNNYDYKFRHSHQIDSVMEVENLPKNHKKYKKMIFYQDSTSFEQYVYIRRTDSTEIVYTITDLDSLYRIKKKTLNY